MKKLLSVFIVLCLMLTLLPATAFALGDERTLTLHEDWRLTGDLNLEIPEDTTLIIDGANTYYIYEMRSEMGGEMGALLNESEEHAVGNLVLRNTILYPAGGEEAKSLSITTASLPAARVGSSYEKTIAISESVSPTAVLSFDAAGLPDGLAIDESTGVISGTPEDGTSGNYHVAVTVTTDTMTLTEELYGALAATRTYSLRVNSESTGGSHGGGGGTPAEPKPTYSADVPGVGSLPLTVDTDKGSVSLNLGSLSGKLSEGQNTVVDVPAVSGVNSYTATLPASSLSGSGTGSLTLNTDAGSLTIPSNMFSGMGLSGNAGITIGTGDTSGLSDDVKEAIGGRPVIQLTLSIDGEQTDWNNPDAPVTASIPYTPTAAELSNPESIVVWYIDGSGNAVSIPNGRYDPVTGTVTVAITHFSVYAVAYNKVSFKDVPAGVWYERAVHFIAARSITGGTGGGNFAPDQKLKRGDFLVMLMKAYGIAPEANPADNFSDAGNTYYTSYLATAKQLGISTGLGNNMFAPDREITRQEMFTLLYNALKVIDKLPQGDSGRTLSDFTDAGQVDSWAVDAMTLLVETGAVGGSGGKLTPSGTTTRAEMAQVVYNLLSK